MLTSENLRKKEEMYRGRWQYPKIPNRCCIYRVPTCIREVNPKAYTPQLVLIGPLHLSLKFEALEAFERGGRMTYTKSTGYLNLEKHKKIYLEEFAKRFDGEEIIDGFKRTIEEEEENIRESYSESTAWINSSEFVEMVLRDSVFIIEFMLRAEKVGHERIGDRLIDIPCLGATVVRDLILLENQLPYFILEKLFDPVVPKICPNRTFRDLIIQHFQFQGKIREDSKFRHFTDLHRCVLVETLPKYDVENLNTVERIRNADKLESGGVKFEAVEEEFSMKVRFENGCLKMPRITVDNELEMRLRNIMALEQCHYPYDYLVCNYVFFLNHLIHNEKDVDLLVKKGIIKKNSPKEPALILRMVNKLRLGIIIGSGSCYSDMAVAVNNYSKRRVNRSKAILKRVCFGNPWSGLATITVMSLLVMKIIQIWAWVTLANQNKSLR